MIFIIIIIIINLRRWRPKIDGKNPKWVALVTACWSRYLMDIDDQSNEMSLSLDPRLDILKNHVSSGWW